MEELLKNQYVGLKTLYETPHICGKCLEHIAIDWEFCPACGQPTGLMGEIQEQEVWRRDRWSG